MKKKGIYITLVIVLAVALLGSAIYLFSYFWSSKQNEGRYSSRPLVS